MKVYRNLTWISGGLTALSLSVYLILNRSVAYSGFIIDLSLAMFGSSLLSFITSVVFYVYERRKVLEEFLYSTIQIIKYLNTYEESFSMENKIRYFLDYYDMDKFIWDSEFGSICFFFEHIHHYKRYIYKNIYTPLLEFDHAVAKYVFRFKWYVKNTDGGKELQEAVSALETFLLDEHPKPFTVHHENAPSCCVITKKLTREIYRELYGKYYKIMYGKTKDEEAKMYN